ELGANDIIRHAMVLVQPTTHSIYLLVYSVKRGSTTLPARGRIRMRAGTAPTDMYRRSYEVRESALRLDPGAKFPVYVKIFTQLYRDTNAGRPHGLPPSHLPSTLIV